MVLGKAAAYALCATVYIAEHSGVRPVQGREIARERAIPFGYLLKVLQQLVHGGILESHVGRAGGFSLKRPAEETTALEIIEAVAGPLSAGMAAPGIDPNPWKALRVVLGACEALAGKAREEFRRITVQQLMN